MSQTYKAMLKLSTYKKPKVKKSNNKRTSRILKYAKKLNKDLPKSEIWFDELFKSHTFYPLFLKNQIIGNYIVDLLCTEKKIVIEIDGSYHDLKDQIAKDFIKEQKLIYKGYKVIRVIAYDIASYTKCITDLENLFL
jgi:very-short-patch-repair endonuclease